MKILFICRQNIFRSLSAQVLLQKYLNDNKIKGYTVISAGTECIPETINTIVVKTLLKYGVDVIGHKQKKLTKNDVSKADLIIVMGKPQKLFMKKYYNVDAPYYNKICCNKDKPLLDVEEVNPKHTKKDDDKHIIKTIKYINYTIPEFFKNIK